jgi:hypothetical protein
VGRSLDDGVHRSRNASTLDEARWPVDRLNPVLRDALVASRAPGDGARGRLPLMRYRRLSARKISRRCLTVAEASGALAMHPFRERVRCEGMSACPQALAPLPAIRRSSAPVPRST